MFPVAPLGALIFKDDPKALNKAAEVVNTLWPNGDGSRKGYRAKPLRRIYIPKKNGKIRLFQIAQVPIK
jgi:hypothetical protein